MKGDRSEGLGLIAAVRPGAYCRVGLLSEQNEGGDDSFAIIVITVGPSPTDRLPSHRRIEIFILHDVNGPNDKFIINAPLLCDPRSSIYQRWSHLTSPTVLHTAFIFFIYLDLTTSFSVVLLQSALKYRDRSAVFICNLLT